MRARLHGRTQPARAQSVSRVAAASIAAIALVLMEASTAAADAFVIECRFRPLVGVGGGDNTAGEAFVRTDRFTIDTVRRSASGASDMNRSGAWSRVRITAAAIALANGDANACGRRGLKGEAVLIDRRSGAAKRSYCFGQPRWITLHWSGTCRRPGTNAF